MNNTIILLRHAKTEIDSEDPVSRWVLSEEGHGQAREIASIPELQKTDVIICSDERKAFHTVLPLAKKLKQHVAQYAGLDEIDRDKGGFVGDERYKELVAQCFSDRDTEVEALSGKWESASSALKRITKQIEAIDKDYKGKTILICGHGITINLYLASIQDKLDTVYDRFTENSFGDWAVIEDGVVVKDIV